MRARARVRVRVCVCVCVVIVPLLGEELVSMEEEAEGGREEVLVRAADVD